MSFATKRSFLVFIAMQSSIEPNPLAESEKYERQQTLGQGSFGFVQLAKNLTNGELAAIKVRARTKNIKCHE